VGETSLVEGTTMKWVALCLILLACGQRTQAHRSPPLETGSLGATPPLMATVDTATLPVPLALHAQLYVEHDAIIYARSAGVVESILVDLGSQLRAGQVIARLESTDQAIALAQAREKAHNAEVTARRERALTVKGFVTAADSEQAELEYREATLGLQKAQRDYDLTRIEAPFSGVVTSRTARLHRLVNSGDTLFRITAIRPVLAAVHVPESSAPNIRVGTSASVLAANGSAVAARVIRASPVLDPASGTREVILQLSGGSPLFIPGSNVTVELGAEPRQVIAIPRAAVAPDGYALVWVDNKTTLRRVTLGSNLDGDRIEVVNGLAPGEKVVWNAP
jgi:RND family efflux transporter MFP subunit